MKNKKNKICEIPFPKFSQNKQFENKLQQIKELIGEEVVFRIGVANNGSVGILSIETIFENEPTTNNQKDISYIG